MPKIELDTLIPHGKISTDLTEEGLKLTTQSSITSIAYNLTGNSYKRHYLELPVKAYIPFRLTMRLKLDYQGLIFLIGDGHILFNCPSNRAIEDPVKPSGKVCSEIRFALPKDCFVTVQITYGKGEMQILIDDKEIFYSNKQPYMKAKELPKVNADGLRVGIEVAKLSTLYVSDIELTEISAETPLTRPAPYCRALPTYESIDLTTVLPPFESFISFFPDDIQKEIIDTDVALRGLKTLKMKRSVDPKNCKLTYTSSDFGISYGIRLTCGESWQSFSFYVVTSGKAETWHRKADYMEEVLQEIAQTDPQLAERIFFALNDCVGCYGSRCIVKTPYCFGDRKRLTCHGMVMLRLCHEDFQDVRDFFVHLNTLLQRKVVDGTKQTKIFLIK